GAGQAAERYLRTASGAATAMMRAHHPRASSTLVSVGPPRTRARDAETTFESGWLAAKGWSHPGIDDTGTKAEEAKRIGASRGKAAACAVSGSPTAKPMAAKVHDIA